MIYLALDQALNTSGWAVFYNSDLEKFSTFSTKSSAPIGERLWTIWNKLDNLYGEYQFNFIFFEDIQHQANLETYKKLAFCQAAIILWCYHNNIDYSIAAPSHWRSVLKDNYKINFGKTRAEQKKAAQQLVEQLYNIKVTQDEADAICIGIAGLLEYNKNRSAF